MLSLGSPGSPEMAPPPIVKPPPSNVEELARQRKKKVERRTNRADFIIDPPGQGVKIQ